ncbi:hypothetical protein TGRH88_012520 [Toxoplasma gondii]|nr:hypothetical protein TGRH88_012520 [Toxoplasma gondii]
MSHEIWRRIDDVKLLLPCRANGSSEAQDAFLAAAALEEKLVALEKSVADIQKQVSAELAVLPSLPALLASAHAQRRKIQQLHALLFPSAAPFSAFGAKGESGSFAASSERLCTEKPRREEAKRREREKEKAGFGGSSVSQSQMRKERKVFQPDQKDDSKERKGMKEKETVEGEQETEHLAAGGIAGGEERENENEAPQTDVLSSLKEQRQP